MRFVVQSASGRLQAEVHIARDGATEILELAAAAGEPGVFWSAAAPQEPHEFEAKLMLRALDRSEEIPFRMVEPSHA